MLVSKMKLGTLFITALLARSAEVAVVRAPEGAMQPQAEVDARGVTHLVYVTGDTMGGDVWYTHRAPGGGFSKPLRVNSQPGSAIPRGAIRGARLALGKNGRVHLTWNGSRTAEPKAPDGSEPMLYSRINDAGSAFEPQRNLIRKAAGLDGGGAVAADGKSRVWVVWHAGKEEAARRVWAAQSSDEGKTFAPEEAAGNQPTGACGCCTLKALAFEGSLMVLYRAATEGVHRDMCLIAGGATSRLDPWELKACPMSSAALVPAGDRVLAAWETESQVWWAELPGSPARRAVPGQGPRAKYPAIARNARGETIVVWTETPGFGKGGALAWQVFGRDGQPTAEKGRRDGVPPWSFATVVTGRNGKFEIIY